MWTLGRFLSLIQSAAVLERLVVSSKANKPGDSDRDWSTVRASNAGVALRLRLLDVDALAAISSRS